MSWITPWLLVNNMEFEAALREELFSITELSNKVFPLNAPEGTKTPYIVYVSSEGVPDQSLDGFLDTKEVQFELNILHGSYTGMKTITGNVLSLLQSFPQRTIGSSGPFIQAISYEPPVELYEPEVKLYRCLIETKVHF